MTPVIVPVASPVSSASLPGREPGHARCDQSISRSVLFMPGRPPGCRARLKRPYEEMIALSTGRS
jgi:hypothetical protein